MKRSASARLFSSPFLPVLALGSILLINGCAPKGNDAVVATIGKTPVTLAEYEKLYERSNGSRDAGVRATQEERERFLDLMVRYRKKLVDAYGMGMDRRPELQAEIQQYKGSLAASYLTDRQLVTPALKKMYQRNLEEIRASHILIAIKQGATAEDSAAALKKANEVIQLAKEGKDFGELALNFSDDPSAKTNRGDLYYFSVGRMVPEFEEAAFAMQKGEISAKPLATRWGYHVLKITDRKPSPGETQVSHIMIRFNSQTPSPEDTLAALNRILPLVDSLKAGVPFADLAKRHSDDGGSSDLGGDLGFFGRARWPQPFDEAAFLLKPGETSPVVRTQYGYHLLHCTAIAPPKSFDAAKQDLQNTYQQQRFQQDHARFLDDLRREVKFARNEDVVAAFINAFDSTKTVRDSAWADTLTAAFRAQAMFTFHNGPVSVDSVIGIILSHPEWSNLSLHRNALKPTIDKVAEQLLFTAKADFLEKQDPEFASLLREYKEGILLYQAEQEQVWNRVAATDSALRVFFDANRDRFMHPDRVLFTEIRAASEADAKVIHEKVLAGMTLEQIAAEDSARMMLPDMFSIQFAAGKSGISTKAAATLKEAATLVKADSVLRVFLSVYADTVAGKRKNAALANQRLDAMKKVLTGKLGIRADRIMTEIRSLQFMTGMANVGSPLPTKGDIQIMGRQPLVMSRLETLLLAPPADERAQMVTTLQKGGITHPFPFKVGYSLVRLEGHEPARQKTYEEAGAEVSSVFQDAEAKRLEKEWMDRVEQQNPVVVNKEILRQAFASPQSK